MKCFILLLIGLVFTPIKAQQITGNELLEKAIQYHDPNNVWPSFHGKLSITMETPNNNDRVSDVILNLPAEHFKLTVKKDGYVIDQRLNKDDCSITFNGSTKFSEEEKETYRLSCDRTRMMKNYYTYLYGLPMKLQDKGTIIDPVVTTKTFKDKEYLVLKATYEASVGEDIWYFYFDPNTYAMEVYQFFHDESKNDGEYILLKEEEQVSGIRMPKIRAWYYNKDDKYLGTDILTKAIKL